MTAMHALTPGGLPDKMARYFRDNPDEELTFDDAKVKFDCTEKQLQNTLARLRAVRVIETPKIIRAAR